MGGIGTIIPLSFPLRELLPTYAVVLPFPVFGKAPIFASFNRVKTLIFKIMAIIKSTITALCLLLGLNACAGNKESKNQNMKGENMEIVHLTKKEFLNKVYNFEANPSDWKYEGDKPCIVDFYATWCGPCKALAPVLEDLAKEYDGKIYVYKVDVDKESELSGAFGIQSIPTLLWIPMAGKPTVTQGAMPKNELKKMIDGTLLSSK